MTDHVITQILPSDTTSKNNLWSLSTSEIRKLLGLQHEEWKDDIDSFPEWMESPLFGCPHSIYVIEGRAISNFDTQFYEATYDSDGDEISTPNNVKYQNQPRLIKITLAFGKWGRIGPHYFLYDKNKIYKQPNDEWDPITRSYYNYHSRNVVNININNII